jgi:ATP-binding cassette subfamily B multidrug efflux pump
LITHRVAAAARCDQVIVLEAGQVVARGQHEQLLLEPGPYAAFAEEQRIERELEALSHEDDESERPAPGVASA